jgi:4-carboxymuconolactone decarboxylase
MNPESPTSDDRFARGLKKIQEFDAGPGQRALEALKEFSPDLARYIVEFPFGDVYSRSELTLRQREIVTVSALAALGYASTQLKLHIHGALNVGISRKEIVEIVIQIAVYAGFPAAMNAATCAIDVFRERDAQGLNDQPVGD